MQSDKEIVKKHAQSSPKTHGTTCFCKCAYQPIFCGWMTSDWRPAYVKDIDKIGRPPKLAQLVEHRHVNTEISVSNSGFVNFSLFIQAIYNYFLWHERMQEHFS